MSDLDETDVRILELLAEDARRSFAAIGEAVGLSGPAVSDRVGRLEEADVLRGFTIDVDRSALGGGVPVLVEVNMPPNRVAETRDAVASRNAVEHVFTAVDGSFTVFARAPRGWTRDWVADLVPDATDLDVTLIDDVRWSPGAGGHEFALSCDECGNTVTAEGTSARLGDDLHHFCCESCEARFTDRYDRFADQT